MMDPEPDDQRLNLPEDSFTEPVGLQSTIDTVAGTVDQHPLPSDSSQSTTVSSLDQKDQPTSHSLDTSVMGLQSHEQLVPIAPQPDGNKMTAPVRGPPPSDIPSTPNSSGTTTVTSNSSSTAPSEIAISECTSSTASKNISLPAIEHPKSGVTLTRISEDSTGFPGNKLSPRPGVPTSGSHVQFSHTPFIQKLYAMLEDPNMEHVIIWNTDGDSFLVNPSNEFSQLLCHYFKHTNISSFVRQLSMYGFHKVTSPHGTLHSPSPKNRDFPWEFRHCDGAFRRGDIEALRTIKRRSSRHSNPSKRQRLVNTSDTTGFTQQIHHTGQDSGNMHTRPNQPAPLQTSQGHPQRQVIAQTQPQHPGPIITGHNHSPGDAVYAKFTYRHPSMAQPSSVIGQWQMIPGTPSVHSTLPSLSANSLNTNSLRTTPVSSHFNSISSIGSSVGHPGTQQIGHPSIVGSMQSYANIDPYQGENALDFLMQAQQSLQLQISELSRAVTDIRSAMEHIRWSQQTGRGNSKLVSPEVTPSEPLDPTFIEPVGQPKTQPPNVDPVVDDEGKSPKSIQSTGSPSNDQLEEITGAGLAAGSETQDRIKLESLLN